VVKRLFRSFWPDTIEAQKILAMSWTALRYSGHFGRTPLRPRRQFAVYDQDSSLFRSFWPDTIEASDGTVLRLDVDPVIPVILAGHH